MGPRSVPSVPRWRRSSEHHEERNDEPAMRGTAAFQCDDEVLNVMMRFSTIGHRHTHKPLILRREVDGNSAPG